MSTDNKPVSFVWKQVVIDMLIGCGIYKIEHEDDPLTALNDALRYALALELDPLVSKEARDLMEKGVEQGVFKTLVWAFPAGVLFGAWLLWLLATRFGGIGCVS